MLFQSIFHIPLDLRLCIQVELLRGKGRDCDIKGRVGFGNLYQRIKVIRETFFNSRNISLLVKCIDKFLGIIEKRFTQTGVVHNQYLLAGFTRREGHDQRWKYYQCRKQNWCKDGHYYE
ncbi:hypothetical protein SDC9_155697 [bioreactor metagenome]|uniref:Uncharacterized protein n=1 Tax=bioreactor metagenome TaxID=1076179 RepID=A0A645F293_9ZZZZ